MMPIFIKVHNSIDKVVRVNINNITEYGGMVINDKEYTRIIIGKQHYIDATETPEEIDDLIEKAQRGY